jgi:hypothetical protein
LFGFVDGEYKGEMKRRVFERTLLLSPVTDNNFTIANKFGDLFSIEYKNFIINKEIVKPDPNGVLYFKLVEAGDGGREEHF